MKKLRLTIGLLAALSLSFLAPVHAQQVGPTNQIFCNKTANLAVGPTGLTQVIPGVVGQTISVCGWHVTNTAATGTFSFSYGTGSNCGTGTTTILPPTNVTSSAPSADHIDFAQIGLPTGNAFCVNPSVATISVFVYYAQF